MLIPRNTRARTSGFGLIELMVSLVVGLIVVGAVLALVVSIMRSNRQTLQATRLTQELRATLAVVSNDLRRARSVDDPLTSAIAPNIYRAVDTSTNGCIRYGYFDSVDDDGNGNADDDNFHVVRLLDGRVRRASVGTGTDATCNLDGQQIGSNQVEVTSLTFTPTTTTSSPPQSTDESVVRDFTVTISGRLANAEPDQAGVIRTVSQDVYVRSVGTGI